MPFFLIAISNKTFFPFPAVFASVFGQTKCPAQTRACLSRA
jgi:hypothetical protein